MTKPFTLVPPDSHLPVLNKAEVNSQLSSKFKDYQKGLTSKSFDKRILDTDKDNENEDPQLVNIQTKPTFTYDGRQKRKSRSRSKKSRKSSSKRRNDFNSKYIKECSNEDSDEEPQLSSNKHEYDLHMQSISSHPLYKNENNREPQPKSKKRKGKLNLIKNSARERLEQEIEFEKMQRYETSADEGSYQRVRNLEAKDDEINKLKSEIDVLNITIQHLHDVLKEKTDGSISQQREIISLNQKINQLSFENTQLRAQNSLITRKSQLDELRFDSNYIEQTQSQCLPPRENESSQKENMKNEQKLKLIEDTEILLNKSKMDSNFDFDY